MNHLIRNECANIEIDLTRYQIKWNGAAEMATHVADIQVSQFKITIAPSFVAAVPLLSSPFASCYEFRRRNN